VQTIAVLRDQVLQNPLFLELPDNEEKIRHTNQLCSTATGSGGVCGVRVCVIRCVCVFCLVLLEVGGCGGGWGVL